MRIGILQTGRTPPEMRARHGDYDDLFKHLLAGRGFTFETYPVLDGVLPAAPDAAEGWLITGSRFGAYEDHAWIPPLEKFLRATFKVGIPIIGVCFGHQILAQALGGKVEKFSGGWSLGPTEYRMADGTSQKVGAWHQDQVTQLPAGAEVLGSSDFCQFAMLGYGDKAFSIQPHPEFTAEFMTDLLEARRDILPKDVAAAAKEVINSPLTSLDYANIFEAFFKRRGHGKTQI